MGTDGGSIHSDAPRLGRIDVKTKLDMSLSLSKCNCLLHSGRSVANHIPSQVKGHCADALGLRDTDSLICFVAALSTSGEHRPPTTSL